MKPCGFTFQALLDYHERALSPETDARLRAHLQSGCDTCQRTLARIERSVNVMQEAERIQVPEAALERAYSIFEERFRPKERTSLWARLTFDSRTNLAFAGARGNSRAAFQRLYSTDEENIDLWEEPEENGTFYLIGQVVLLKGEIAQIPHQAILARENGEVFTADQEGDEFHFAAVPAGAYRLTLQLPEKEIVIPDVVVGE